MIYIKGFRNFKKSTAQMINAHKTKVQKTAHYYTIGSPGDHIKNFWIICHGYGQLASNMIRKFTEIDDNSTFILAPEGLSRFYWGGVDGNVAASWMTKQDRLEEIADYSNYLKSLYDTFRIQLPDNVKITLLGFSQGCATQCRWIMREFPEFDNLILWAGLLPEDLDYTPYQSYFNSKKIIFVYGKTDQYVTSERLKWQEDFSKKQGLKYETYTFEGRHEIDRVLLKKMASQLKLE